jgi:radical SAM-linked protein
MRVQYAKGHPLRFLSHLDMIRLVERTIRRAGLPIQYSEGFHPHPRIAFGPPLALGLTSRAEYMDLQFAKPLVGDLGFRMRRALPPGFRIVSTRAIFRKTDALSAVIDTADYRADISRLRHISGLEEILRELLGSERLIIQRSTPKETRTIDVRDRLVDLGLDRSDKTLYLLMRLRTGPQGHIRPHEVLELALGLPREELLIVPVERTAQYIKSGQQLLSPLDVI